VTTPRTAVGPLLALAAGLVVAIAGLIGPAVAAGTAVAGAALVAIGQRRGDAWIVVSGVAVVTGLAAVGVLTERDASPLLGGVLGVLLFGAVEAGSWSIERRGITDLDGSPAWARLAAVGAVSGAALVLAGLLAESPSADPTRISVALGAAATSALLLGAAALVVRARRR
jgi:hypothetical protein